MKKILICVLFSLFLFGCDWLQIEGGEVKKVIITVVGYNDYYSFNKMAVRTDITNYTKYRIEKISPKFIVYQKQEGASFISQPTVDISIKSGETKRNVWIVLDKNTSRFYESCTVKEVIYWDSAGVEHAYTPPVYM